MNLPLDKHKRDLLRKRAAIAVCRSENTSVRCECSERSDEVCADMLATVDTVLRIFGDNRGDK